MTNDKTVRKVNMRTIGSSKFDDDRVSLDHMNKRHTRLLSTQRTKLNKHSLPYTKLTDYIQI